MPNIFGKWCRPNYNSAVATFCHNIARGLPIEVRDASHPMTLVYIDEVLDLLKRAIRGELQPGADGFCAVGNVFRTTLGEIADTVRSFADSRRNLTMPRPLTGLGKALYSTFLSCLPEEELAVPNAVHADARGLFAELFRTESFGQFSVSTTAPGIVRGNHWHHTKTEKFIVVSGQALIRIRRIDDTVIQEIRVSGDDPKVVDIPPGTTHSIENSSPDETLVTLIWASELFDPEHPDTYPMEVQA